jgi:hypothetical protein
MKSKKHADPIATQIRWGIELETRIPITAGVHVGAYHRGHAVHVGIDATSALPRNAPVFQGKPWQAERDGSIRCDAGQTPCEFVSPILHGDEGVENLLRFVDFTHAIGATVNDSCGCHITVGIESVIGTDDPRAVSEFIRKLAHISRWHARSLYGQTGTGRHLNHYSHPLFEDTGTKMRRLVSTEQERVKAECAEQCGRGMVNFRKAFKRDAEGRFAGVVEFRVFAGTLNPKKILHHLATVLGLCRRAHEVRCLGGFTKNEAQRKRTATAVSALAYLHDYLGWAGSKRPVALGLFGALHRELPAMRREARRLCQRFDERYPDAPL